MMTQGPAESGVGPDQLPPLVLRYAERAIGEALGEARTVVVRQEGEMTLKPGARPRPFTATERFAVDRVAFAWLARFPVIGPISLQVTDSYDSHDGLLEVRLLGLPLRRQRGPEFSQGEAYRYLAEIAWAPWAIFANRQLEWRELDERAAEVATRVGDERVAVRLEFNDRGEIERTFAKRPRPEAGNAITPWIGEYREYRERGGAWVPTHGEVRWELPDGPFTYWRGTISSLELCDSPAAGPSGSSPRSAR